MNRDLYPNFEYSYVVYTPDDNPIVLDTGCYTIHRDGIDSEFAVEFTVPEGTKGNIKVYLELTSNGEVFASSIYDITVTE